jgi:hypothetical protein
MIDTILHFRESFCIILAINQSKSITIPKKIIFGIVLKYRMNLRKVVDAIKSFLLCYFRERYPGFLEKYLSTHLIYQRL